MVWRIEVSLLTRRDMSQIHDFIRTSCEVLGETQTEAARIASRRIEAILTALETLATAPRQGTLRPDLGPNIRHVTKDRAIFYFELIETSRTLRILAIFYGGQDHDTRILARILGRS